VNIKRYQVPLAIIGIIIAMGIVGNMDAQEEERQIEHYCEMVAIWKADAARGVPANDRAGWPPFDGECK